MKKLFYLLIAIACMVCAEAQVGIGTTAPNSNAVLDIFSPSKGFLIPRIVDTGTVANPLEGMIIYNKNTKTPYYHDGKQWLSLGGRFPSTSTTSTDRITYKVTAQGFSTTEEEIFALSQGVSLPVSVGSGGGGGMTVGVPNLSSFNFTKKFDINSKSMNLASIQGAVLASVEIQIFASGAQVPYLSYRFKNVYVESYQISGSAGGDVMVENISIAFENYGFKDWVNNFEFGYNIASKSMSTY